MAHQRLPQPSQEPTEAPISKEAVRNHQELRFETAELQTVVHNLFLKPAFGARTWKTGQQFLKRHLGEKWHTIKPAISTGQIERLFKDGDYHTDGQTGITGKSQPVFVNLCAVLVSCLQKALADLEEAKEL